MTTAVERARVYLLAVALFVMHVAVNYWSAFEFQRDEFLYLAMGDHLQWWRMDFPPFIALVSNVTRAVAGDSLVAIRLGPALAASALVMLAAITARKLGGGVAARWLSALAVVTAPVVLRPGMLFQPVVFDQLWWTCALLALIVRQQTNDARWWVAVGIALGVGLLTKFSIAFIGVGIVVGMLLTPLRRDLLTRWPWIACLLALAIGSASLVGQWQLDYPILWQMRDLNAGQLERRAWWEFVVEQPSLVGVVGFVLALIGFYAMLWGKRAEHTRAAAIAMLVSWVCLSLSGGKGYYGAPVYPVLMAAGVVSSIEMTNPRRLRLAVFGTAVLMIISTAIAFPLALPVLSPEKTAAYASRFGSAGTTRTNYGTTLPLPQDFADMLGWEAMVKATAEEWNALSAEDRARGVLGADNYGEAGAIDYYGKRFGLPRVISGAGSYWFFGPGDKPGEVLLVLGTEPEELQPLFARCERRRVVGSPWAVEEEQQVPITLCRGPKQPLQSVWPMLHPARE